MAYAFAPGVFACLADGRLVVLNVHADRYLMLPRDAESSVLRLGNGEPDSADDTLIRDRLCTHGLVLQHAPVTRIEFCSQPSPTESLIDGGWVRSRVHQRLAAGISVAAVMLELRARGLGAALNRTGPEKRGAHEKAAGVMPIAGAYADLRLAVRALDRCLPLSLALARDAKRRNAQVRLVLGVQCNPFAAHAWVQLGDLVLNDRLDTVNTFTPILSL